MTDAPVAKVRVSSERNIVICADEMEMTSRITR
jgi:hypothetical protein